MIHRPALNVTGLFAKQCSLIPNKSVLPLLTENSLSKCNFSKRAILPITRNLDLNKAHGHDMISMRMSILCGDSICKPLGLIIKTYLRNGRFPPELKKANVGPIHKKGDDKPSKTIVQFYFYLFV